MLRGQFDKAGLSNISISNRGINGGFVLDLINGLPQYNISGFEQALAEDKPTIVVIFIGTNDVWFPDSPRASNLTVFPIRLADLVGRAQDYGALIMLSELR